MIFSGFSGIISNMAYTKITDHLNRTSKESSTMPNVHILTVQPNLPEKISDLKYLAYNLHWAWDHQTIELFRRMDRDKWEEVGHNPVILLGSLSQDRLEELARDDGFVEHMISCKGALDTYLTEKSWYEKEHGANKDIKVAYFSAEFGISECVPIYSGGLGMLAGDHLKSASDLGIPLVGVGLLYQHGYFRQYLNMDGWQQERYPVNDFFSMPLERMRDKEGNDLLVRVRITGIEVTARIWKLQVGRISLYLLDTNVEYNTPQDREITDELYGGGNEHRIRQEMMLGIGGMRALEALGIEPDVCHMNEGHSAFLSMERIRQLMVKNSLSFEEARTAATAGNIFTTHTPVPAGNDWFDPLQLKKHISDYLGEIGISYDQFLGIGQIQASEQGSDFGMTVLALRNANHCNGVSRLHGDVARGMWKGIWPELPKNEVPIGHVTNGIHPGSWLSREMSQLYDRYIGSRWRESASNPDIWDAVENIPAEELWRTHERRRERLVAFARKKLYNQLENRGAGRAMLDQASEALNPEVFTIGFARRFATYKRAGLLFHDAERLKKILLNRDRPLQIIIAGKAHPRDNMGKELIKDVIHFAQPEELRRHIVFLEDYDMALARSMVQGVDIWLNTPLRPMEACGTSGMKAAFNGVINFSIPDGWWDEVEHGVTGWDIGHGEDYQDQDYQNDVESSIIYDMLEKEILPMFYTRSADGIPRHWVNKMKKNLSTVCRVFSTSRMLKDYTEKFYLPAAEHYRKLSSDSFKPAKSLLDWKQRIESVWPAVQIASVEYGTNSNMLVGQDLDVTVNVTIDGKNNPVKPEEIEVQAYYGQVDKRGYVIDGLSIALEFKQKNADNTYQFAGDVPCIFTGKQGFSIRVVPRHSLSFRSFIPGLIRWEK